MSLRLPSIILPLLFLLFACGDEGQSSSTSEEGMVMDSMVEILDVDVAIPESMPALAPELIGVWRFEEMRYGNTPMSMEEVGESTLEFTSRGTMIASAPGLEPEETSFSYTNDVIISDYDSEEQYIEELTADRLVLVSEIDQTKIRRVYSKVNP